MNLFNWFKKSEKLPDLSELLKPREINYKYTIIYKINENENPYFLETDWGTYEFSEVQIVDIILYQKLHKQIITRTYEKIAYDDIKSISIVELDKKIMMET